MGLDISLYKARRYDKESGTGDYFTMTDERDPEMDEKFGHLYVDIEEEYFDFEKAGITDETPCLRMQQGSPDGGDFHFGLRKHPLYPLFEKFSHHYGELARPKTVEEGEKTVNEVVSPYLDELRKAGWKDSEPFFVKANGDGYTFYPLTDFLHDVTNVVYHGKKDLPTKIVIDKVLGYDEIGYQRKGLKGEWYDAYERGDFKYFCTEKRKLEEIRDNYCSDEEIKEYFDKTFVQPFIEGEMFVGFDW